LVPKNASGKRAVIAGRSPILGKPMALMLSNANATVTLCHSKTVNLEAEVRRAELIVGAVGKPEFIPGEWISDGAIVIDAGYHVGGIGDIASGGLLDRCAAVTPVPLGRRPDDDLNAHFTDCNSSRVRGGKRLKVRFEAAQATAWGAATAHCIGQLSARKRR